jgi:hypothetical protein
VYLRALTAAGAERSPRLLPADEIERVAGRLPGYEQRVPEAEGSAAAGTNSGD